MENIEFAEERIELAKAIAEKIQNSGVKLKDIRKKEWMNIDCKAAEILKLLIKVENLLMDLDDYSLEHDQCYSYIAEVMLKIGDARDDFCTIVENNIDILDIK